MSRQCHNRQARPKAKGLEMSHIAACAEEFYFTDEPSDHDPPIAYPD